MYEIYGAPGCSGCVAAESYLRVRNIPFVKKSVEDLFAVLPNVRSIPQIFKDGEHIGQFDDLVAKIKTETA